MKNKIKYLGILMFLISLSLNTINAQRGGGSSFNSNSSSLSQAYINENVNVLDFCGIEVTVFCDGSVDVIFDGDNQADIFRVFNGPDLLIDFNNFNYSTNGTSGNTITGPVPQNFKFNTSVLQPPNDVLVTGNDNFYVEIKSRSCGRETFNLSDFVRESCPPSISFCGVDWTFDCDGSFRVDFNEGHGINKYQVYLGGTQIAELSNYDPNELNVPEEGCFFSGNTYEFFRGNNPIPELQQFGNPVPVNSNFFISIATDCGNKTINFSRILEQYYSGYDDDVQPDQPCVPSLSETCPPVTSNSSTNALNSNSNNNLEIATSKLNVKVEALIYPNPVNDILNIQLPELEETFNIQLISLDGKVMSQSEIDNGGTIQLTLSSTNNGVYLIRIQSSTYNKVEKIKVDHN